MTNFYKNHKYTLKLKLFSFRPTESISKIPYQQIEDKSYYGKQLVLKVICSRIWDYFESILFPYIENMYLKHHFKRFVV